MHALGTTDDVAEAVRYLVSDEAHYLTGVLLPVAGGLLTICSKRPARGPGGTLRSAPGPSR